MKKKWMTWESVVLQKAWAFLKEPANMAVLVVIGGATAWFWDEIKPILPFPHETKSQSIEMSNQKASASGANSASVNASGNASVTIGEKTGDRQQAPQSQPHSEPLEQSAEAEDGGTAINAADSAEVSIQQ